MNLYAHSHHESYLSKGVGGCLDRQIKVSSLRISLVMILAFFGIEAAVARPQCPPDLSAALCKAALEEANQIETELEGVNVSDSFARQLQNAPEEHFKNSPCYYRIMPSLEVKITRCKAQ